MTTTAQSETRKRNWAWIWLAYTGFLFIDPIFDPSLRMWLGSIAVLAVFLGIFAAYVRATDDGSPFRYGMIAATFALGLLAFPWNQGASCLFIYAAAFVPFTVVSVRRVLAIILAECLVVLAEGWYFTVHVQPHTFFHVGWANTWIAIFLMVIIGGSNVFFAEQRRTECKLRAAEDENHALAAVAERERIARDLHDVLGHTLSVIVLKAELAKRLVATDPARAAAEIADVERTARTALTEVREAITGYRARGLAAEIEAARRTLDSAGVTVITEDLGAGAPGLGSETWGKDVRDANSVPLHNLTPQQETVLALALREAVTNIVRHARATTCTLRFVSEGGARRLVVEDNGTQPIVREGNGLRGMRERLESIGGQLLLQSDGGHGTRLLITLPLETETA